jgi:hypothetical protein
MESPSWWWLGYLPGSTAGTSSTEEKMDSLKDAVAAFARENPDMVRKMVAELKIDEGTPLKLESDKAIGHIEYFTPKDREANRWEIGGELQIKGGPEWTQHLKYKATLILGPEGFFDIDDWEGDQKYHPEMRSLVWHNRPEVKAALPDKDVTLWSKLAGRIADKWLDGEV